MLNTSILKSVILPLIIFVMQFILQDAKKYNVEIERTVLNSFNPVYIEHWDMKTRRANRNAPYTCNINFTLVNPIDNNVTIQVIVYEKVNAEYKLTPLEIHFRLCEWMKKDKLVIPIVRRSDVYDAFATCPLKGNIYLKDLIIKSEDAPTAFWPFVKNKFVYTFYTTATKETLVQFTFFLIVNEVPEKRKG